MMRKIGENIAKPNKTMPKYHPWNLAKFYLRLFSLLLHAEISKRLFSPLLIIFVRFWIFTLSSRLYLSRFRFKLTIAIPLFYVNHVTDKKSYLKKCFRFWFSNKSKRLSSSRFYFSWKYKIHSNPINHIFVIQNEEEEY